MIDLDHVLEIALLIAAAYMGGCAIGAAAHWALRSMRAAKSRASTPAPVVAFEATAVAEPTPPALSPAMRLAKAEPVAVEPVKLSAVRRPPELPAPRGVPDDLKRIKGIGKKTESSLNDLGIYHFHQIAAWEPAHIVWLEGRIAVKGRIQREQWVEQATLLLTELRAAS